MELDNSVTKKGLWFKNKSKQRIGLISLSLILLGVIFVLPKMVPEVDPSTLQHSNQAPSGPVTKTESPWQDAQLAKARKEAQNILEKILPLQKKLEQKNVTHWAKSDYEDAAQLAEYGDSEYRQRNFLSAQKLYQQALEKFDSIYQRVDEVYQSQLTTGRTAIASGDSDSAKKAFTIALDIAPSSEEAQAGLAQAQSLQQVLNFIRQGQLLEKTDQLSQAKDFYQQALDLDPQSNHAQKELARVEGVLEQSQYAKLMSSGYRHLDSYAYSKAIEAFKQAQKLRPAETAPTQAIVQANNQRTKSSINQRMRKARSLEQKEQWSEAKDLYQQVLNIDSSIINARIGLLRSEARASLNQKLEHTINNPDRLLDPGVHHQAQQLLVDAQNLNGQGPLLEQQIQQLQTTLQQANTEVSVLLQSDNLTSITIYRVGELGTFAERAINLKPGSYTLVGTRNGYRDVRRQIQVLINGINPIQIQCSDKVDASNG